MDLQSFINMTDEEKIAHYQNELDKTEKWAAENWHKTPVYIRMMIVRGQGVTEEKIRYYKSKLNK
jgi:hypothetical protein